MLQAVYGGDPMAWLASVPMCVVRGYWDALERTQAKLSLQAVERLQIGTGHADKAHGESAIARWVTLANRRPAGHGRRRDRRIVSPEELAAAGMPVRIARPTTT